MSPNIRTPSRAQPITSLADTPPWPPKRRTNSPMGTLPRIFRRPAPWGLWPGGGAAADSRVVGEGRVGSVRFQPFSRI